MYYPNPIEEVCYSMDHIEQVLAEIKTNFPKYFSKFVESENGYSIDQKAFTKLSQSFGNVSKLKKDDSDFIQLYSLLEN